MSAVVDESRAVWGPVADTERWPVMIRGDVTRWADADGRAIRVTLSNGGRGRYEYEIQTLCEGEMGDSEHGGYRSGCYPFTERLSGESASVRSRYPEG